MCASPCTAIASMPGLATRRAIACLSCSDALAPSTSPDASWVNDSIHIVSVVLGRLGFSLEDVLHTPEEAGGRHRLVEHLHVLARRPFQDDARELLPRVLAALKATSARSSAFEKPHLVAHPPARNAQPLQVIGFEGLVGVGIKEPRTGHNPVLATVGRTSFV